MPSAGRVRCRPRLCGNSVRHGRPRNDVPQREPRQYFALARVAAYGPLRKVIPPDSRNWSFTQPRPIADRRQPIIDGAVAWLNAAIRHECEVRWHFGKPQSKTEQSNSRVWATSNLQSAEPVAMCPESLAIPPIRFANVVSSCSAAAKSGLRRACLILAQRRSTDPRRQQSGCQASS